MYNVKLIRSAHSTTFVCGQNSCIPPMTAPQAGHVTPVVVSQAADSSRTVLPGAFSTNFLIPVQLNFIILLQLCTSRCYGP